MMQLFSANASPFARKVRVVLYETGQVADVELLSAEGSPMNSSRMPVAHNPLGKLPTLVRPDGPAIYDSRVICQFLNARAKADLYPQSHIWETLTLEATGDGVMEAALLMVYEGRSRPENMQYAPWVEGQWGKVTSTLDAVNARWMSHLAGPVDAASIAMGCALGYLDFRLGVRDWRQGRDGLAAWYEGFSARESMQATVPS
ncbi:MAG: glutathione S-transferase [Paracoccaceae bacterium]|jgi:glutathione S-transferase|tara:strand:+ start:172 stop:777 length:606 start_codon:yes stop_codon:yes gene_type:complete